MQSGWILKSRFFTSIALRPCSCLGFCVCSFVVICFSVKKSWGCYEKEEAVIVVLVRERCLCVCEFVVCGCASSRGFGKCRRNPKVGGTCTSIRCTYFIEGSHPVQIFLRPPLILLSFISRSALIWLQIDSNTSGSRKKYWSRQGDLLEIPTQL